MLRETEFLDLHVAKQKVSDLSQRIRGFLFGGAAKTGGPIAD